MKARWSLLAALPALTLASVALAADAKTYAVTFRNAWKAGDTVTVQSSEREGMKITVTPPGQPEQVMDNQKTIAYTAVVNVVAADPKGNPTQRVVYFASWSFEANSPHGPVKLDTLTGAHIEVNGTGKGRSWRMLTQGKDLDPTTQQWLEGEFGAEAGPENEATLDPKEPVAPGAKWPVDVAALASDAADKFTVDLAKSSCAVTFVGVEATQAGEAGQFTMEMELHTKDIAMGRAGGRITWTEGGVLRTAGTMGRLLDPAGLMERKALKMALAGKGSMPGGTLSIDMLREGTEALQRGGQMPPVPGEAK